MRDYQEEWVRTKSYSTVQNSQEAALNMGSRYGDGDDFYVPQDVLSGLATIQEAEEIRKAFGFFPTQYQSWRIGLDKTWLAIGFANLDPETGRTIHDFTVLGMWDTVENKIIPTERDLTAELRQALKKADQDLPEARRFYRIRDESRVHLEGNNLFSQEIK